MNSVSDLVSGAPAACAVLGSRAKRRLEHALKEEFFIAADEDHLLELATVIATMPWCASGQIFIEVADASSIETLAVPSRVSVRWLIRSERSGAPGTATRCGKGQALLRATQAWIAEMCPDRADAANESTKAYLLSDYIRSADLLDELVLNANFKAHQIHTAEKFALASARW